MSHHQANMRAFNAAQQAYDNMAPSEDDGGLEPCVECDAKGCVCCDNKGYFMGEEPMTRLEYDKFIDDMREPA